jgi:hypothetical protein
LTVRLVGENWRSFATTTGAFGSAGAAGLPGAAVVPEQAARTVARASSPRASVMRFMWYGSPVTSCAWFGD